MIQRDHKVKNKMTHNDARKIFHHKISNLEMDIPPTELKRAYNGCNYNDIMQYLQYPPNHNVFNIDKIIPQSWKIDVIGTVHPCTKMIYKTC